MVSSSNKAVFPLSPLISDKLLHSPANPPISNYAADSTYPTNPPSQSDVAGAPQMMLGDASITARSTLPLLDSDTVLRNPPNLNNIPDPLPAYHQLQTWQFDGCNHTILLCRKTPDLDFFQHLFYQVSEPPIKRGGYCPSCDVKNDDDPLSIVKRDIDKYAAEAESLGREMDRDNFTLIIGNKFISVRLVLSRVVSRGKVWERKHAAWMKERALEAKSIGISLAGARQSLRRRMGNGELTPIQ